MNRGGMGIAGAAKPPPSPLAVVALGSNLGDPEARLQSAIERLRDLAGGEFRSSCLYRTAPVDCPPGSPDFFNAVVVFRARAGETPEGLLQALHSMESAFGRRRGPGRNEPRPLDLDLIAFGEEQRNGPILTLPHPRAHVRRFVLEPLAELAPDLSLPGWTMTASEYLRDMT